MFTPHEPSKQTNHTCPTCPLHNPTCKGSEGEASGAIGNDIALLGQPMALWDVRHISGLGDHNGRPFHHGLCTLSKALARLRSGLLFRPALVVRIVGTIQERWSAVVDGIFSLEPQRIRLSGLGQSRELQLPRTATSAPAALSATLERCQRSVQVKYR